MAATAWEAQMVALTFAVLVCLFVAVAVAAVLVADVLANDARTVADTLATMHGVDMLTACSASARRYAPKATEPTFTVRRAPAAFRLY
jgi:hypothetical protein